MLCVGTLLARVYLIVCVRRRLIITYEQLSVNVNSFNTNNFRVPNPSPALGLPISSAESGLAGVRPPDLTPQHHNNRDSPSQRDAVSLDISTSPQPALVTSAGVYTIAHTWYLIIDTTCKQTKKQTKTRKYSQVMNAIQARSKRLCHAARSNIRRAPRHRRFLQGCLKAVRTSHQQHRRSPHQWQQRQLGASGFSEVKVHAGRMARAPHLEDIPHDRSGAKRHEIQK